MKDNASAGAWGGAYGLALIGALVYYLQHATSVWMGIVGIFKALFWPGFIMYRVLELMHM